jgi:hypothetical protein
MMYMLIPEIYSEHASHLYVLESTVHLSSCTICTHYYGKGSSLVTIVITRFVMKARLLCYLPLNIIDEFRVSRFIDVKRVQYKNVTLLQTYYC